MELATNQTRPEYGIWYAFAELADKLDPPAVESPLITAPKTDQELQAWVWEHLGVWVSDVKVCDHHCSPLQVFADCYFARHSRVVLKGSRGFAGKTVLLAALSLTEAITLGAGVSLLGGSGEQSMRVHGYMCGEDPALPQTFWAHPNAPTYMRKSEPSKRETVLSNRGYLRALMASQASVRGPHPQRLRGDEIDEMDPDIWDAAQGQPMEAAGIREQVLASSTHQYPYGCMSRELENAEARGWPIYELCWKESVAAGWLTEEQVERKRATVSAYMFETEYDLQQPGTKGTRVYPCFDRRLSVRDDLEDCGGDLHIGMDFNVDPMSAVIAVRAADELHILDEIELRDSGTEEMCEEIKARYCGDKPTRANIVKLKREPRNITIYPDPSGGSRKTSAPVGVTDLVILRKAGFQVRAPQVAPPIVDRVNEVNALLCNAQQRRRLLIHTRCASTRKYFDQLTYKEGTSIVDKGLGIEHLLDGTGYMVHVLFPIVGGNRRVSQIHWG